MAIGRYRTPEQFAESSGKVNERFVFGAVRINDPDYEREKRVLVQRYRDMKKPVPFREALGVIKRFQPFKPDSREPVDPSSPIKQFPYALRKFIADGLGFKSAEQKKVLFWTAVDSLVDKEFGADAVIEVKREKGELSRMVRLDVTLRSPEKAEKGGDSRDRVIVYGEIQDPHFDKKAFDAKVDKVGKEVIEKLNAQSKVAEELAA